jgi:hypothetical protein
MGEFLMFDLLESSDKLEKHEEMPEIVFYLTEG